MRRGQHYVEKRVKGTQHARRVIAAWQKKNPDKQVRQAYVPHLIHIRKEVTYLRFWWDYRKRR